MRALQKAATADRLAATWYGLSWTTEVKISDGLAHKISLYLVDWDGQGRSETIQLVDASTGLVLDSRAATAFSGGQYFTWAVTGRVLIRVTLTGGANAVNSALFFGAAAPVANSSTSAVFLATDTTTRGSWKGVYGTEGYSLANDATSLPAYATVTQQGSLPWTWVASTTDARALQKAATADRLAATWYGTTLTLDVKISDGLAHKVSLYLLDWDDRGRSETIQLVDASTGLVLDSRSAAAFSGGQYFTWVVTGRVLIRVNLTGAANAVYSALFFDR